MDHYEPGKLVSLGTIFTISMVLVFGSILLSPSIINVALAVDMPDAPATQDTVTAGNDGNDDNQDEGNDQPDDLPDPEDAPVTTETITPGENEGSKEDDDNSGQSNGNNGNGDNAERATSDEVTNKPDCPVGQEPGLFTPCMPIQESSCDAAAYNCIPIQSCGNDVAASQPRDLTVTELDNCNEVWDPDSIEK